MSTLYVSEFSHVSKDPSGNTVLAPVVPSLEQNVAIGDTSAQSNAFSAGTTYILIATDATCFVAFGTNPTATVYHRLAANESRFYSVSMPNMKVAVIQG